MLSSSAIAARNAMKWGFRFRVRNRLLAEIGRRWITLDRGKLLQNGSRKTRRCVDEQVQCFAGECRRDQTKANDCPKHEDAIISDLASPSKSVPRFAWTFTGGLSCLYRAGRDSHGHGESQIGKTCKNGLEKP